MDTADNIAKTMQFNLEKVAEGMWMCWMVFLFNSSSSSGRDQRLLFNGQTNVSGCREQTSPALAAIDRAWQMI